MHARVYGGISTHVPMPGRRGAQATPLAGGPGGPARRLHARRPAATSPTAIRVAPRRPGRNADGRRLAGADDAARRRDRRQPALRRASSRLRSRRGCSGIGSTAATTTSTSEADYWSPDLATSVPTVANGGVETKRLRRHRGSDVRHLAPPPGSSLGRRQQAHVARRLRHVRPPLARLRRARQAEPDAAGVHGRVEPGDQVHRGWTSTPRSSTSSRSTDRIWRSAAGSTASCRRRCSTRSLAARRQPRDERDAASISPQGSGNAAAFKGTATLAAALDGTGPFVHVELHARDPGGAGAQSRLLEPEPAWPTSTRSSSGSSPTSPPRRRTCAPARSRWA